IGRRAARFIGCSNASGRPASPELHQLARRDPAEVEARRLEPLEAEHGLQAEQVAGLPPRIASAYARRRSCGPTSSAYLARPEHRSVTPAGLDCQAGVAGSPEAGDAIGAKAGPPWRLAVFRVPGGRWSRSACTPTQERSSASQAAAIVGRAATVARQL